MESIFETNDISGVRSNGTLIIKGMPEALLPKCAYYINSSGEKLPLLQKDRQRFDKMSHRMGAKGLRPILITYLPLMQPIHSEVKKKFNIKKRRDL
jgi:magnesium-transporting ATPase (P-type)